MSSALWHFFWTTDDWTGAPPAPVPTPPPPPAVPLPPPPAPGDGSGGGHGKDYPVNEVVPPDFWDIRESYLRSLFPPEAPPPPEPETDWSAWEERQRQLAAAQAERSNAVAAMRGTKDIAEMKAVGAKIKELAAKIDALKRN